MHAPSDGTDSNYRMPLLGVADKSLQNVVCTAAIATNGVLRPCSDAAGEFASSIIVLGQQSGAKVSQDGPCHQRNELRMSAVCRILGASDVPPVVDARGFLDFRHPISNECLSANWSSA